MSLELEPLCTVTITSGGVVELGATPAGRRYMTRIAESVWEGERLRARLAPGTLAGDWLVVSPDGVGQIDIRLTLQTDDGALIYVQYFGRRDFTQVDAGVEAPVYITPRFETSDPKYAWLNKIQAVGKGATVGEQRVYEVYELR